MEQMAWMALPEQRVLLVQQVLQALREPQDQPARQAGPVPQVPMETMGQRAQPAQQARRVLLVQQV